MSTPTINDNAAQIKSKRRKKEGESPRESKSQKTQAKAADDVQSVDSNPTEEADAATPITERVAEATPESSMCAPTLSSPEPETPNSYADAPIQSRANVDLATLNLLSSDDVAKLRRERDRLEFGG